MEKEKVLVGMSGGVDSSVAALLLQQQGYEVAGATFALWPGAEGDAADAARVCKELGIPHHIFGYGDAFREHVVDYFAAEYSRGATPNPCVACNRHIKFGAFLASALEMGFDYIATGHYAAVLFDGETGRYRLRRAEHPEKDQSYVLYTLTQERLRHVLLPLGIYTKREVRRISEESGLPVSHKAESQDICFVPGGDYAAFLEEYTGKTAPAGHFVDGAGNRLGPHRGVWRYTIGQRKGLGMGFGKPMYVTGIDPLTGNVSLGEDGELMKRALTALDAVFLDFDGLDAPRRLDVKLRYNAKAVPATVMPLGNGRVLVEFDSPQRAVTPGQAAVFYDGDFVAGGATIEGAAE